VTQFLDTRNREPDDRSIPPTGFAPRKVPAMTDRRLLRRYLALVRHADELLDECSAAAAAMTPAPAEAVAVLDDPAASPGPIVRATPDAAPDPGEVRRQLAGWVH